MALQDSKEYTIFDNVTPIAITSSTDATPIVVTATTHGFSDGDLVLIYGHTTNIAANGIYRVANATTSTLELTDKDSGADIAGSGATAGSGGLIVAAPKVPLAIDFVNVVISVFTSGTATLTLKAAGAVGSTPPNFGATVSATNRYDFIETVNLNDGSDVDGGTGVAATGTDLTKQLEFNINRMHYLTVIPTAWTQGAITVKMVLSYNN